MTAASPRPDERMARDRRRWLQQALAWSVLPCSSRLWAANTPAAPSPSGSALATDAPRFLLVFLRGGYDAAHLLVPYSSSLYHEARRTLAVPPPSSAPDSALRLDDRWALHPAVRSSLGALVQQGQAAFIPFAGIDEDLSRSHFETQDSIELGQVLSARRDFNSGFMNRLASELGLSRPGLNALSFTDQLPLVCRGTASVANLALKDVPRPAVDAKMRNALNALYAGQDLAPAVRDGLALRDELAKALSMPTAKGMDVATRAPTLNARGFEAEAQRIAQLMRDRYAVGFVDVGGWDTHVNQGTLTGDLPNKLDELGRGLSSFAEGLGPAWAHTTVMVISEFGRTFRENGNRGTDHGHGSCYWLLGGSLAQSGVIGEQVELRAHTLHQQRDWPVLNDYRGLLARLWQQQFGLSDAALQRIFPQVQVPRWQMV